MKALLILAEGFEEMEAVAPIDILRRGGVEVTVAGLDGTSIKSARGLVMVAEVNLDQVTGDFDALVLPGGGAGAKNLAASPKVNALISDFNRKGKLIAAICATPAVALAPSGVLSGKTATCFPGMETQFGPDIKFTADRVAADGNLITSRAAGTAVEFSLAVLTYLAGAEESLKVRKAILA